MFNKRGEQDKAEHCLRPTSSTGSSSNRASTSRIPAGKPSAAALAGYRPRLQVMRERCPNLIRTIPAMVRDTLDPEDLADKVNGIRTEDDASMRSATA
jgi:hypothetical protein